MYFQLIIPQTMLALEGFLLIFYHTHSRLNVLDRFMKDLYGRPHGRQKNKQNIDSGCSCSSGIGEINQKGKRCDSRMSDESIQ